MDLSIIIVNYNVTNYLRKCLQSIQKYAIKISYEVIVIDNQSTDISWKDLINEFPEVKFIANPSNDGFSKANNTAIKQAKGDYLLLLNPDTELESYLFEDLLSFAKSRPQLGCLGVRMHDAAGIFLPESKRSVPDMFNSFEKLFLGLKRNHSKSYYRSDLSEDAVSEVEVITGAFLLCKREVYNAIGGLDEQYFMYGEDIDLCYTFLQRGYQNYYYGKHSILHHKGESTVKDEVYLQRFYGAMQIFLDKYYKKNWFQHRLLSWGLKLKHTIERKKLEK